MCGILLTVGLSHDAALKESHHLIDLLRRRGPDGTSSKTVTPLQDPETGCITCWNGEAWKIAEKPVADNDTVEVHRGLVAAAKANRDLSHSSTGSTVEPAVDHVIKFLISLCGPYSFVFHDALNSRTYFGRDFQGRRSLLFSMRPQSFMLSSTGDGKDGWTELDSDAIYVLHVAGSAVDTADATSQFTVGSNYLTESLMTVSHFPWANFGKARKFNRSIPPPGFPALTVDSEAVSKLEKLLTRSIAMRVQKTDSSSQCRKQFSFGPLLDKDESQDSADKPATTEIREQIGPKYAVLFSGGLDCSILARMLHDQLPITEEIELLNAAFENPRLQSKALDAGVTPYDLCPDRETAKRAYQELCISFPDRYWRLVEINVPYTDYLEHRDAIVSIMHPHDTEMDLSIATALFFAGRAQGHISFNEGETPFSYDSNAKVLFSGLGADELFGGYQRHATAFSNQGYDGLLDALELDVTRLGKRNLGRDDRVISHWGKEVRYPYLDEDFVQWAVEAPVWEKCGFGSTISSAENELSVECGKQVLRLFALRLGLPGIAQEKKRAIQFGARTAKMDGKSKGTETIRKGKK